MTIPEYNLLMKSVRLKQVDLDYRNHLQAFLNFSVKAEKKAGKNKSKPVYSKFKRFYNYEKELEKANEDIAQAQNTKSRFLGIGKLLKREG